MKELRESYKTKRRIKGKSITDLSSVISRTSISKFENGGDIKLSNFVKLLELLDHELIIIDKRI